MTFQKITPFLWFESQAEQAITLYTETFPNSKILRVNTYHNPNITDPKIISADLQHRRIQSMNAGPFKDRNPSFSYMVACRTEEEVDGYYAKLSTEAKTLMPLQEYDFCKRYVWLEDRYNISWQLMHDGGQDVERITPCLLFVGDKYGLAEEAMNTYCEIFQDATPLPDHLARYGEGEQPDTPGNIKYARFRIFEHEYVVMESASDHAFTFNEMQSLYLSCGNQEEVDHFTSKLIEGGGAQSRCGWCRDRFGVSWQVVPKRFEEMMQTGSPEQIQSVMGVVMKMDKIIIEDLEKAFRESL